MGVSNMRYTLLMILAAFAVSACNIDPQRLARASCAMTQECYAPGVTPGTNPYRKTQSSRFYPLESSWINGTNRMCKYSDGSVINNGIGICPLRKP